MAEEAIKNEIKDNRKNIGVSNEAQKSCSKFRDEFLCDPLPKPVPHNDSPVSIDRVPQEHKDWPGNLILENHSPTQAMEKVGTAADKLAQLTKDKASPEELKKAFGEFEKSTQGIDGRQAAKRLDDAFNSQKLFMVEAKYNDYTGKFEVIEHGIGGRVENFKYDNPNVRFIDPGLEKDPALLKAADDFAARVQKGVSTEELKQLLPELLDKMSKGGLVDMQAAVMINWALDHTPNNKYSDYGDSGPLFMLDGKPAHLWIGSTAGEFLLNYQPASKKLYPQ